LTSHCAGRSNTSTVLAGSTVYNGINSDLNGVLIGEEVDDVKGVLDNTDCHQLFTIVAAVHHERVCESFDDRALGFAETFRGIAACRVGEINGCPNLDVVAAPRQLCSFHWRVIREGDVFDFDIFKGPLVEKLDGAITDNFGGENGTLGGNGSVFS
jgi:hypothetical protein